jgi:hypothetical protein
VLILAAGCASYDARLAPIATLPAMPTQRSEGAVSAGADPYWQRDRQTMVFDADLASEATLPVQVIVVNHGERTLLVRPSDITLTLPDGTQLNPSSPGSVAAKLAKTSMNFWPTFFFGLAGAFAAGSADEEATSDRQADYRSKELPESRLGRDASAQGFVYFISPAGASPFTQAILSVRFVDTEEGTSFVVQLPLSGIQPR